MRAFGFDGSCGLLFTPGVWHSLDCFPVAEAAGVPLPVNKPVTGPAAFAVPETEEIQEAFFGPASEGRLDEALTFPPGLVGNAAQMSIGRKCSTWTVAYGLLRMDLISQDEFAELVRRGDYPVMPASA